MAFSTHPRSKAPPQVADKSKFENRLNSYKAPYESLKSLLKNVSEKVVLTK